MQLTTSKNKFKSAKDDQKIADAKEKIDALKSEGIDNAKNSAKNFTDTLKSIKNDVNDQGINNGLKSALNDPKKKKSIIGVSVAAVVLVSIFMMGGNDDKVDVAQDTSSEINLDSLMTSSSPENAAVRRAAIAHLHHGKGNSFDSKKLSNSEDERIFRTSEGIFASTTALDRWISYLPYLNEKNKNKQTVFHDLLDIEENVQDWSTEDILTKWIGRPPEDQRTNDLQDEWSDMNIVALDWSNFISSDDIQSEIKDELRNLSNQNSGLKSEISNLEGIITQNKGFIAFNEKTILEIPNKSHWKQPQKDRETDRLNKEIEKFKSQSNVSESKLADLKVVFEKNLSRINDLKTYQSKILNLDSSIDEFDSLLINRDVLFDLLPNRINEISAKMDSLDSRTPKRGELYLETFDILSDVFLANSKTLKSDDDITLFKELLNREREGISTDNRMGALVKSYSLYTDIKLNPYDVYVYKVQPLRGAGKLIVEGDSVSKGDLDDLVDAVSDKLEECREIEDSLSPSFKEQLFTNLASYQKPVSTYWEYTCQDLIEHGLVKLNKDVSDQLEHLKDAKL